MIVRCLGPNIYTVYLYTDTPQLQLRFLLGLKKVVYMLMEKREQTINDVLKSTFGT